MEFSFKVRISQGFILILATSLFGLSSFQGQTNKKIGFADFEKVKLQMPKFDSLLLLSSQHVLVYEQELYALTDMIQKKSNQMDTTTIQDEKHKISGQLQDLTAMLNNYSATAKSELSTVKKALFHDINQKLIDACEQIKRRENFDYIYDSSNKLIPPTLGAQDLTNMLIVELGL